ncbi:MAG: MBL fold metallo-hydrolase [Planctomycetota bacterium]
MPGPRLTFLGAAGTVTGSRFVLETGASPSSSQVLVDCGLFQGVKSIRKRNREPFGFPPRELDAVVLTHAHIDHSGYLPALCRDGYSGAIHCTPATADLAELLMEDSARIQQEDARYANRKGFSKHSPALPLYTVEDAIQAGEQLSTAPFDRWFPVAKGVDVRFRRAGHIIGSALVETKVWEGDGEAVRVLFSGDVGRYDAPLVPDPTAPSDCDVLVVESTYGDRSHPTEPVEEQLRGILERGAERGSTIVFASFAVGRAQQLVYLLSKVMRETGRTIPIHLDSPMAANATRIYRRYPEESGLETVSLRSGASPVFGANVYVHREAEESKRLNDLPGPRVIIASSGMMTGGRVLHHLKRCLPNADDVVVLVGYQAPGTRGRRLQDREPTLRIHGRDHPVRARIEQLSGLSAHADADELIRWLGDLPAPKRTFIVHGDDEAREAFAARLTDELGHSCVLPQHGETHHLLPDGA